MAGEMTKNYSFHEHLPEQCPPDCSVDGEISTVYRLVSANPPTEQCFESHAAQGKVKPPEAKVTDCSWASCSLFTSVEALKKLKGLKRRNPYMATLVIPQGAGRHHQKGQHVDFWRYSGFDILGAVVAVEVA